MGCMAGYTLEWGGMWLSIVRTGGALSLERDSRFAAGVVWSTAVRSDGGF